MKIVNKMEYKMLKQQPKYRMQGDYMERKIQKILILKVILFFLNLFLSKDLLVI